MIDVIIPIYKGLQQTRRCVDSVLQNRQSAPFEVVAVDDASPDPEITGYLDELAAERRITLVRNESNLGFVQSVNRGMSLHPDRDVVLLNSDTEVANDWLDRLLRAAYAYPDVGTVTPFSNNATICSYPFEGWARGVPGTLAARRARSSLRVDQRRAYRRLADGRGLLHVRSGASASIRSGHSTRSASAAATARRTISACAPPAPAGATCSPATCSSITKAP